MGEGQQHQQLEEGGPGERGPVGDWVPFVEFRFRWDPYRKAYAITKRGLELAPSWEECPDKDYLTVSAPPKSARAVAVELVSILNGQRTAEQIPPAQVVAG